jgi:NitT/TauT family transport system permease protein
LAQSSEAIDRTEKAGAIWNSWVAIAPPTIFVVVLVAIWAALSAAGKIPVYLLPSPAALLHEFQSNWPVLARHSMYTVAEAAAGFAAGSAAAIVAAIAFVSSRTLRAGFYPLALASRAIPIVAVTPLLVILFGFGAGTIILVVAIVAYFPTLINMVRGLESADVEYHELLYSLSASHLQNMLIVQLPASVPFLFSALRVTAASSFVTAITGEWIGSHVGLGYLVMISGEYFKIPTLWAAVLVAALFSLIFFGLVAGAERLIVRWPSAVRDDG